MNAIAGGALGCSRLKIPKLGSTHFPAPSLAAFDQSDMGFLACHNCGILSDYQYVILLISDSFKIPVVICTHTKQEH